MRKQIVLLGKRTMLPLGNPLNLFSNLKSILPTNLTFYNFWVPTLIKEDTSNVVDCVIKSYCLRTTKNKETSFLNYGFCVESVKKSYENVVFEATV